jgi:hypothetical protein
VEPPDWTRLRLIRSVVLTAASLGSIVLLQGPSSAARQAYLTTVPSFAPSATFGGGGPVTIDGRRSNRNVTKRDGPQSEAAVAVDPTNANDILAASNDVAGPTSAPLYEGLDAGGSVR